MTDKVIGFIVELSEKFQGNKSDDVKNLFDQLKGIENVRVLYDPIPDSPLEAKVKKVLSPKAALTKKAEIIHPGILEVVDLLLAKRYNGSNTVKIKQNEIVELFLAKHPEIERSEIWGNNWMDFESIYRNAGWSVYYDQPGYDESYDAYFEFKETN